MDREKFSIDILLSMHNLNLVSKAKALLQNFIANDRGAVWLYNKDGSKIKLEPGFEIVAIDYR